MHRLQTKKSDRGYDDITWADSDVARECEKKQTAFKEAKAARIKFFSQYFPLKYDGEIFELDLSSGKVECHGQFVCTILSGPDNFIPTADEAKKFLFAQINRANENFE